MGYARILKDSAGQPSGYRECDREVCWMPERQSYDRVFRRVKIDVDTMEVLNHDFIKDRERVYRIGLLLRGISPAGFRVFNPVYTGGPQVIYTPYGDAKVAHPESFQALDQGDIPPGRHFRQSYGRDEEFVYFFDAFEEKKQATRLRACKDPASFRVLELPFARDDRRVYCAGMVIKEADAATFVSLGKGYARDAKRLFFWNRLLEESPEGFVPPEQAL